MCSMVKSRQQLIISAEGIVWRAGRYLTIVRGKQAAHAPGMLAFPGGGIETPAVRLEHVLEENVRREVMEETGIQIQDKLYYLESVAFLNDERIPSVHLTFLCRYKQGEAHIASSREVDAVHWLTVDEILQHPNSPTWIRRSIRAAEHKREQLGW